MKTKNTLKITEVKVEYKKPQCEDKLNSWKNKPLHGKYMRNIDEKWDNNNLGMAKTGEHKKETQSLLYAAEEKVLQTNVMKDNIQGISISRKYWLG